MHRDLKPMNLLIDFNQPRFGKYGVIKLADFGLARKTNIDGKYTTNVASLWYRAPELLIALQVDVVYLKYSCAIDIWSIGCIFAEMAMRKTLFQQNKDSALYQLENIVSIMGPPTKEIWPVLFESPYYRTLNGMNKGNIDINDLVKLDTVGLELLKVSIFSI
jgi:serine/threonine protein kinase